MGIGAVAIVFPFRSQVCNVSASFQIFSVVVSPCKCRMFNWSPQHPFLYCLTASVRFECKNNVVLVLIFTGIAV